MKYDEYDDEIERIRARSNRRKVQKTQTGFHSEKKYPDENLEKDDFYFNRDADAGYDQDYEPELDILDFDTDAEPGKKEFSQRKARPQKPSAKKKKKKKKFPFFRLLLLAAVVFAAIWIYRGRQESGYWTVAVFGVDSRDGSLGKGALSDVEMIASINRATGEITLISVFRDTYLEISTEGTYHKINEAYFRGGPEQAVEALERNLDLQIDDYATFNWKSVADTINLLGGIDLEITDAEFAYINSFITETAESTGIPSLHLTQSGFNHLDGVQAVAYARLRLMDTDFNRTQRQRKVLTLVMEKAKQADIKQLTNAAAIVLPQISTSVGLQDVLSLAGDVNKYHIGETSGFPFSHSEIKIGRMDCVVPTTLESNVIQLHAVLYGDTAYAPSSTVARISAKIAADSGLGEAGTDVESGRDSSGSSSGGGQTQAPTVPPETVPEEIPTEETTAEGTEASIEESIEETDESPEESEEPAPSEGPGSQIRPTESADGRPEIPSEEPSDGPGQTLPEETEPVTTEAAEEPATVAPAPETEEVTPGV